MQKTNQLIVTQNTVPALYQRMQIAIAECYSIDDCQNIATQAAAIAAYYKQIKDDESVKQFLKIKIRAWRRIGEILIESRVDKSKCETTAEYIRKLRFSFKGQKEVENLSDNSFRQALRIVEVPKDFFEQNVNKHSSIDSLLFAFADLQRREWEASPEGKADIRLREKNKKIYEETAARARAEQLETLKKQAKETQEANETIDRLLGSREEAIKEVGVTLERRDREEMHETVFLLKKSIHEVLRQAAFDHRLTMQAILRAGLMMWFVAHGYAVPVEDMNLPNRKAKNHRVETN